MTKYSVNLMDGSFAHQVASGLGGDCSDEPPNTIVWNRNELSNNSGPTFMTDMLISSPALAQENRIAWLLEPPSLSDTHYKNAVKYQKHYKKILTFHQGLLEIDPEKYLFYPFGGSWIRQEDWGLFPKERDISMIASFKRGATGHKLRHRIAKVIGATDSMNVDIMGSGYRAIASKIDGLRVYRYSIVVESCKILNYFSEKLIDCLSQGTIPIYWGCPNIGDFFDKNGILAFDTVTELHNILTQVCSPFDYGVRWQSIEKNIETASKYRTAEDWITERYPELFNECKRV